jgi:hypothetical protein
VSCQFVVACASGFIQRRESLVDQQDVHIVNILLDYWLDVWGKTAR